VFNGRARIWDKIFLSHFASIGFVAAIKLKNKESHYTGLAQQIQFPRRWQSIN
jgi:hypothetical protein